MTETKKSTSTKKSSSTGFSAEERAAAKERAAELRAEAKRAKGADKEAAEAQDVQDKIAAMNDADRELAERVHAVVTAAAPELKPKTWYGMPAYARDGKIVVFFQDAGKFDARYATLGFNDAAALDEGSMWATTFALTTMTKANEAEITKLVKKAVSRAAT